MAVLQMQRISVCALKKDRKKILELLQQKGVVEIERMPEEDSGFQRIDTAGQRAVFEKNANAAENALEILQIYVPEKKSMLASLEGKIPVDFEGYSSVAERQDAIMGSARQLISLSKHIAENKADIVKRENQKESLEPWKPLDVPMNFTGTDKVAAFVGTLSSPMTLEQIYTGLKEAAPDLDAVDVHVISTDRDQTYVCVLGGRKDASALEEALRSIGFAKPTQAGGMVPEERQKQLAEKIRALQEEIARMEAEIADYAVDRRDLELVSDYYRTRAAKYEVLGELLQSKKTFVAKSIPPPSCPFSISFSLD